LLNLWLRHLLCDGICVVLAIRVVEAVVIYDIVITSLQDRLIIRAIGDWAVGGVGSGRCGSDHGVDGVHRFLKHGNRQRRS
jgi:hypothetical protein